MSMIIERQRGGQRNDFDMPALEDHSNIELTDMVTAAFLKGVQEGLKGTVDVSYGKVVTEDSKFYPIDRRVPEYLYPDLAEFVRTKQASTDLRNFIAKIISVQVGNFVSVVLQSGKRAVEFHPADTINHCNTTALPVYAFLIRLGNNFYIQTETSFRVFDPEPEVEASVSAE